MLGFLGIFVRYVKAHMIDTVNLHFVIDGPSHYITRRERQTWVILLHKLLAVRQTKNSAVSAHSLSDKISGMGLARVVQGRWVELYELHVLDYALGAMNHCYAVTGGDVRIGSCGVNGSRSAGSHKSDTTQVGVNLPRLRIDDVGSVALFVRCAVRDTHAQMVLGDDFYGEVVFQNVNIRVVPYRSHQSALNFRTGVICVVENAKLRVSAFTM